MARPWRIRSRTSPGPVGTAPTSGGSVTTGTYMLDNACHLGPGVWTKVQPSSRRPHVHPVPRRSRRMLATALSPRCSPHWPRAVRTLGRRRWRRRRRRQHHRLDRGGPARPGSGHPGHRRRLHREDGHQGRAGRGRRGPVQPDPHLERRGGRPAGRDRRLPLGQVRTLVRQRAHRHRRRRRGARRPRRAARSATAPSSSPRTATRSSRCPASRGSSCCSTARTSSTRPGLAAPTTYDDVAGRRRGAGLPDVAGFVGATVAGDAFTEQTFEEIGLGNGCELVDDAARSPSTATSAWRRWTSTASSCRTTRSPARRTSTPRGRRTSPGRPR